MDGLTIDIERCLDGVELANWSYRRRTDRTEIKRIALTNLENPIVVAFVNAASDRQLQQFFGEFGFVGEVPHWETLTTSRSADGPVFNNVHKNDDSVCASRALILHNQSRLRGLLHKAGGEDPTGAMTVIDLDLRRIQSFQITPTLHLAGPQGTPHLLLKSTSLIGFMLMEIAMVITHGVRTTECEKCGDIFLTGHLTGRRSHAKFCSDRCRVAAMRARKAANA